MATNWSVGKQPATIRPLTEEFGNTNYHTGTNDNVTNEKYQQHKSHGISFGDAFILSRKKKKKQ